MNIDRYSTSDDHDDYSQVHFSSGAPRHRSGVAPGRMKSKRKSFRKRPSPNGVRSIAHRSNRKMSW